MKFGRRLALFLVIALALIQGLTGASIYEVLHESLVSAGKKQLKASESLFIRELNDVERQVSASVKVLTLDFPLRQAIAQRDHDTIVSALRNHGRRVGAVRMLLIGLDGKISEDTDPQTTAGTAFRYPDLLSTAVEHGHAGSVVAIGGTVNWMIVVPVLAPTPIAFVGAVIPLNDHILQRMQDLAALPKLLGLFVASPTGWIPVAGENAAQMIPILPEPGAPLAADPAIVNFQGSEDLFLANALVTPTGCPTVVAVMFYPVTEALRQFHGIVAPLLGLLFGGMILATWGAWMIARTVSRPIELLAEQTRRIGTGDYSSAPVIARDEIGELSSALTSMTREIRDREEHIRLQATHDSITGLPNRTTFTEVMGSLIDYYPAAVIVIGLVRLEEIGHTVGREIANRLMHDAGRRLADTLTGEELACIGERSFAIYAPNLDYLEAVMLCKKIIAIFDNPYREGDMTIDSAAAIGVALIPDHGKEPAPLLRRAEVALQSALNAEGRLVFYDPAVDPHRPERLSLMSELRESLKKGHLQLYYQPKLDIEAGLIGGAEALVRWLHPERGFIPPDLFIGLAEETGNIQRLTQWALDEGISQAAVWYRMGYSLRVSINLSVRDLSDAGLPRYVTRLLRKHALPAEFVVLEVTETAIMREPDAAISVLRELAQLGITLSIDDFGVGQSSLVYLRQLPVRELKIDKTFILTLVNSAQDRAIVRSVTQLGHNLGYKVTAEGVENEETLHALRDLGCDFAQGYHIAKALPVEDFEQLLTHSRWGAKSLREPSPTTSETHLI